MINSGVSVINCGAVVRGKYVAVGGIDIYGKVLDYDGDDYIVTSSDNIFVGEKAEICGSVKCSNIEVKGRIDGDILVFDKVILKNGCIVNGNVSCKSFIAENGVNFDGALKIDASHTVKNKNCILILCRRMVDSVIGVLRRYAGVTFFR